MDKLNEFDQPIGQKIETWQETAKPGRETMQGQYCRIEFLDIDKHAAKLFVALTHNNPGDSWTYLPYGPFSNVNEFCDWIKKVECLPDEQLYAILDEKTQEPIGICGFLRINPTHGSIEIGHIHFSSQLKKTPAATEAIYLMMHKVFDELNYRRCEWKCHSLNLASIKAAKRLGFTYEGLFRQSHVIKNHNRDTMWFSIIDSEWPQIKNRILKWLSNSNFDNKGHQKVSLRDLD